MRNTEAQEAFRAMEMGNCFSRSFAVVAKPFHWVAIKNASLADCVPVVIRIANRSYMIREHIKLGLEYEQKSEVRQSDRTEDCASQT
jgi:hypothetical protein